MARPKKDGLDYFPHDVDATTDPKLEPAIMMYGAAAYAFYFVHLEYCYRSSDLSLDISAAETGAEMRAVIQQKLRISADEYEKILQSLLRHGAFDADVYKNTGKLTSSGIHKRAEKVLEKREKETVRYNKNVSAAEMGVETPQSKEKDSKVKESKAKQTKSEQSKKILHHEESGFDYFWSAYPRKAAKQTAQKAWDKLKPDKELQASILRAIEKQKRSPDWKRENGQYIPYPATWLNQGRWEDEERSDVDVGSTENRWAGLSVVKLG